MSASDATTSGGAKKEEDKRVDKSPNVFEDMDAGKGSTQIFVSSTGDTFSVARATVGIDALQTAGQLSDNTAQQISRDHRARVVGQHSDEFTRQRNEELVESAEGGFTRSYGIGQVVQQ